ncbi:hypothetical protein ACOJUR_11455 [Alicyclobacillus tolerans]|uniref:Uncharacterized protein n=1 Tax=Alicyclobacillus tolerans TaxID=90970 RepID=A0A1M6JYR0_9BACL|nr:MULTISPECIES: hypothetical protein [Alicyclobacillus]QRF23101.1 hypothetical protein FY534_04965 [Alicyclobacillus sp. TC]SHJ51850.1 hypothetical protein SAMN05443507_10195 [Alicyclobacillus montanus]
MARRRRKLLVPGAREGLERWLQQMQEQQPNDLPSHDHHLSGASTRPSKIGHSTRRTTISSDSMLERLVQAAKEETRLTASENFGRMD